MAKDSWEADQKVHSNDLVLEVVDIADLSSMYGFRDLKSHIYRALTHISFSSITQDSLECFQEISLQVFNILNANADSKDSRVNLVITHTAPLD